MRLVSHGRDMVTPLALLLQESMAHLEEIRSLSQVLQDWAVDFKIKADWFINEILMLYKEASSIFDRV